MASSEPGEKQDSGDGCWSRWGSPHSSDAEWHAGHRCRGLCARDGTSLGPCSQMAPASQAGLGSAWNNHVDLLVTSLSFGAVVDWSKSRRFSEPQKKTTTKKTPLSLVTPGCSEFAGWTSFFTVMVHRCSFWSTEGWLSLFAL